MARRPTLSIGEQPATDEGLDRSIVRSFSDRAIFTVSLDGVVTSWNGGAQAAFGYTADEMLGVHFAVLFTAEDVAAAVPAIELRRALTGTRLEQRRRFVRKNGTQFWALETVAPMYSDAEELIGRSAMVRDVSDLHRALEDLRASEQRLKLLIESVRDYAIVSTDRDGSVTSWNAGARDMFGYSEGEIVGRNLSILALAEDSARRAVQTELSEAATTGRSRYERWLTRRDGTRLLASGEIRRMTLPSDGSVRGFVTVTQDVTERSRVVDDLTRRALYDDLTDLPNRRLFYENVQRAIALTKRHPQRLFAILFIDLDHFKQVNDDLGHIFADSILASTARLLAACIRSEDLVARLGGDEFAILLDGIGGLDDAREAAERIQLAMQAPLLIESREVTLTASIGIALSRTDYSMPEDVLQDADTAMYSAKLAGRARVAVFGEARSAHRASGSDLLCDLRAGLERGELALMYQPIVSVESMTVIGFEALVRWQHPTLGLLEPAAFLPLAQGTDLMPRIDRWVLRRACAQLQAWQALHAHTAALRMSVNVCANEFAHPGFVACVRTAVDDFALAPGRLALEITQTVDIERSGLSLALLAQVRELGVEIHIDDFGSGDSALALVGGALVDALKINRSFIGNVHTAYGSRLVGTIVSLAAAFGVTTVAEGLETPEQLTCIRAIGCQAAQGFLLSRPLDVEAAAQLLDGHAILTLGG